MGDSTAVPGDFHVADSDLWPSHRKELLASLERKSPVLAEMYEACVQLAFGQPFPSRVRLLSHCVREISNRLPDVFGVVKARRVDAARLDQVAAKWGSHYTGSDTPETPEVPVPLEAFTAVQSLMDDHVTSRQTAREKARLLFEAVSPGADADKTALIPVIARWLNIADRFMKKTHVDVRGKVDSDYDIMDIRKEFSEFEGMMAALLRQFYSTVKELDEILEQANI